MKRIFSTLSQKWPEYLLEILVITIGILAAYALNNWNEERKEDKLEIKLLKEVQKSVEEDSVYLSNVIENMERVSEIATDLKSRMLADEPYSDTLDFLFGKVAYFYLRQTEDYALANLEDVGYAILESDTLRKMIPKYFNASRHMSQLVLRYDLPIYFRERIYPKYFKSFSYGRSGAKPKDWEALKKEDEMYVALDYIMNDTRYYGRMHKRLLNTNSDLRKLIGEELTARQ